MQDTHAPLAAEVELEAATEWEEQAHAAAEDVADAMDLEDEPVAAEIDELLEIDEPITADDLTDAEFVTEPMAAHADATFVELDEEAGTDEFAEPAYEYARHEEPSAELLDEEEAAAIRNRRWNPRWTRMRRKQYRPTQPCSKRHRLKQKRWRRR